MKLDQMKNTLIGLFVIVAIGLVIGIILFIEPSVGDGKQVLNVRFSNINGINVGTRVLFAGKPVGEVVKIETIPGARGQPVDELGNVYFYQLVLHIDSHVEVFTTDELSIQTSGLLGEKSIAIIPKLAPKGVTPRRVTAQSPVYADSVDPIENAFHHLTDLAEKMEETFDKVNDWIDDNGHSLGDAVRSFDSAMSEFSEALASVNENHVIDDAKDMINSITSVTTEVDEVIKQMRCEKVFHNFAITMDHAKNIARDVDVIASEVAQGKGTLGRIVMSDDFYLEIGSIISKIDTLMNDVNHYGILFNLNKEWQRTRLKRVTMLNALKTPSDFRDYFEKEVDSINTSMSRLSMLIERAEDGPEKEMVIKSRLFREDFADLLRKTNTMLENLKLYNEQLEDAAKDLCQ